MDLFETYSFSGTLRGTFDGTTVRRIQDIRDKRLDSIALTRLALYEDIYPKKTKHTVAHNNREREGQNREISDTEHIHTF